MKAYHLKRSADRGTLNPVAIETPTAGPGEVRVRIGAVSLNYRDLLVLDGAAQGQLDGRIPVSDGAGVVDAIGPGVSRWAVGDSVAASFFRDWIDGPFKSNYMASALGGDTTDGVMAEYIVLPESALVAVPEHLSIVEAATLPCAAVTAWQALMVRGGLAKGDTLLVQGTGGVALFAVQIAAAIGARTIVISSSDNKLAAVKRLGADVLINYRETPAWDAAVLDATDQIGVTHVLELGGPDTYERSLNAVAAGGTIAQIGVLTGFGSKPNLWPLQAKNADIVGITVGSVVHFEEMNAFLSGKHITPVIDKVFAFDETAAAYDHLRSGQHVGKICIRM